VAPSLTLGATASRVYQVDEWFAVTSRLSHLVGNHSHGSTPAKVRKTNLYGHIICVCGEANPHAQRHRAGLVQRAG
jgi:hypothetical protein